MNDFITQRDAASRQLSTAIRMYFSGGDQVAVHTLACAAREIFEKHCERTGIDRLFDHIREAHALSDKNLWTILNGARNFFKHPSDSLDDAIELRDSDNKAILFVACHDCAMLLREAQPVEVQAFNLWFMATEFPSDFQSEDQFRAMEILKQIDAKYPGLRQASPCDQKAWGNRILTESLACSAKHSDWQVFGAIRGFSVE